MDIQSNQLRVGLVLPGGGARGAFQVGVLRAIADLLPHGTTNPFAVISGTSAGAINSVVLASRARRFRVAVAELNRVWGHFRSEQVFRTDSWTMLKSSLHWLTAVVSAGNLVGMPGVPARQRATTRALGAQHPLSAHPGRHRPRLLGSRRGYGRRLHIGAIDVLLSGRLGQQAVDADATRRCPSYAESGSSDGEYRGADDLSACPDRR